MQNRVCREETKVSTKKRRRGPSDKSIRIVQLADRRQKQVAELLVTARQFRSTLAFEATDEEITKAKRHGRP
jgi:hypothetical protein